MNNRKEKYGILPLKKQYEIIDNLLEHRLDHLLPKLMKETGIDLWILPSREYNEDPVFNTLIPPLQKTASRLSILVFHFNGETMKRYSIFGPNQRLERFYENIWDREKEDQWACLNHLVTSLQPKTIGVNYSENAGLTDGISHGLYEKLKTTLGSSWEKNMVSAENLSRRWLETRTKKEIALYQEVYAVAASIIEDAFSGETITPGKTTTEDLQWWIHEVINDLGLRAWFSPDVSLQRKGDPRFRIFDQVIQEGDLLHCDIGIEYLTLCTDTQRMAYVLKDGETEVPKDLVEGFEEAKAFQDIVAGEFKEGRRGNEILESSLQLAKKQGLHPRLYSHPIGLYGHAIGMNVGLFEEQEFVKTSGEHRLRDATCYALELNIWKSVDCWEGPKVYFMLEETTAFIDNRLRYLPKRQEELLLIK
ncbi:M24 family metallopeptidase [Isachenkonia alkalipeptolytica]|uniref:Aminopeptidase P family protein n=1 Tax=Isachenkonia alkalipeptolytica TaxID=2565777 RepID=A0AA43XKS9_9CLOT|nr:M24 family metallopeptidase [Isachenkonia alkalipeptolytica]NBG88186.1 aminopeptidase P family protein [Isachenkonia alkalipeptolytica]